MIRLFPLALLAAATPALAQTGPAPQLTPPAPQPMGGPPPEFIAAAQAFGACMKEAAPKVPATVTPEDGATQAIAGCAKQRTELDTRFTGWVNGPGFPEAGRAMALQQYKAQMDQLPLQIADGIRKSRAAPAATPTPAPTPTK